ncbi:MAG: hypothetical protein WBA57_07040 [Elainellaceae cyanobacterium]
MYHNPYSQDQDTVKVAVYEAQESFSEQQQYNEVLIAAAALLSFATWLAFAGF